MQIIPFTKLIKQLQAEANEEVRLYVCKPCSWEELCQASKALGKAEAYFEVLKILNRVEKLGANDESKI